jgi:hypothetical protein
MPAREHESGGEACSEVETDTNFRLEGAIPGSFLAVLSILKIIIFVSSWRGHWVVTLEGKNVTGRGALAPVPAYWQGALGDKVRAKIRHHPTLICPAWR